MKNILCSIIFLIPALVIAQQYNATNIPDSLTKDADVVKRYEELIYEIKSPSKAKMHERHVYTILNESGNKYEEYITAYDKFISINSASGILYDNTGKELKRVKKKDMEDVSGAGEENLMTDTRYKVNHFYHKIYPYTVDYEEDDDINGIRYFDDWFPQNASHLSVQYSKYVIIAPKDYLVRYKQFNFNAEPVIIETAGKKIYTWEIKNLPARLSETFAPSWNKITPYVMLAPSEFEAEGYKGNMSTWASFGAFNYQLIKGRDV
ncbi:MAG TPA: DUF3857 domain-containing protein, partial [Puia sp.]|nr:DUF3857 domain-containing protein [Puia sp.]